MRRYSIALLSLLILCFSCNPQLSDPDSAPVQLAAGQGGGTTFSAQDYEHLSVGLQLGLAAEPEVELLMYQLAIGGFDEYYFITYDILFQSAQESLEIDFATTLDQELATFLGLDPAAEKPYTDLLTSFANAGYETPHILMPFLADAYPNGVINDLPASGIYSAPKFGYLDLNNNGYPIPGVEVDASGAYTTSTLTAKVVKNLGVVTIAIEPGTPCIYMDPGDCPYFRAFCRANGNLCRVCPSTSYNGNVPFIQGGANMGNHEIQIDMVASGCIASIINDNGSFCSNCNFATVSSVPGFYYYRRIIANQPNSCNPSGNYLSTVVVERLLPPQYGPITAPDENGNLRYNYQRLSFCNLSQIFYEYPEQVGTTRLATGGIYEIKRPLGLLPKLYFAFPHSKFLRFNFGPDMRIKFFEDRTGGTCVPTPWDYPNALQIDQIEDIYRTDYNEFVNSNVPGPGMDAIISTDYNAISNYWNDNVLVIGFGTGNSQMMLPQNIYTLYAGTTPNTSSLPTGACFGKMASISGANPTFEIFKSIPNNVIDGSSKEIVMHVTATYENGEFIDKWIQTDLIALTSVHYSDVSIEFRGKITSYYVDMYESP